MAITQEQLSKYAGLFGEAIEKELETNQALTVDDVILMLRMIKNIE